METDIMDHMQDVAAAQLDQLSDKEYAELQHYYDVTFGAESEASTDKMAAAIKTEVDKYVVANLVDSTTQNIVVVDKSQKGEKLDKGQEVEEIYHKGLPATIVDFDPKYRDTQKDVAIIKLGEKNLPALSLGSTENLASGVKVEIFGFPYNAQMNNSDWFEPTLTQGVVGAIKENEGQKIIQLDNKISEGSSGSPLIDEHGNVLGIITYQTSDSGVGDGFGYALPVELVKEAMAKHQINNDLGVYGTNMLLGFSNQDKSFCKKALENFSAASQTNMHFPVGEMISKYTQDCQALITNKMSKDSAGDIMRIYFKEHAANAMIFSTLILIALVLLGFLGWLGIKRFRNKHHLTPNVPSVPIPASA
jgi:hypothetical protein